MGPARGGNWRDLPEGQCTLCLPRRAHCWRVLHRGWWSTNALSCALGWNHVARCRPESIWSSARAWNISESPRRRGRVRLRGPASRESDRLVGWDLMAEPRYRGGWNAVSDRRSDNRFRQQARRWGNLQERGGYASKQCGSVGWSGVECARERLHHATVCTYSTR